MNITYKSGDYVSVPMTESLFWNRVGRDPYFMYVENSLELADQYWVEHNRKVVTLQAESTKSNEEEIIENTVWAISKDSRFKPLKIDEAKTIKIRIDNIVSRKILQDNEIKELDYDFTLVHPKQNKLFYRLLYRNSL